MRNQLRLTVTTPGDDSPRIFETVLTLDAGNVRHAVDLAVRAFNKTLYLETTRRRRWLHALLRKLAL
jgi:acyl-CoA reductase-like NAD-dependent aldehyde dehydrogenase